MHIKDEIMKVLKLAFVVIFSAIMLSSCGVNTVAYSPDYSGYTVGYGATNGYYGYGTYGNYGSYGGWASSYYSPIYRYNH